MNDSDSTPRPEFRALDRRIVTVWRVASLIALAVPAVPSAIAWLVLALTGSVSRSTALIVTGAGVVVLAGWLVLVIVWPGVRYRNTSYRVDALGLTIRRGVLVRSEVSVPRTRVQHTDVNRGPVERAFGLATLVVYTAGTEHSSVLLGGLTEADAVAVRDFLIEGDDRVDDAV